jgi:hypothetical protein
LILAEGWEAITILSLLLWDETLKTVVILTVFGYREASFIPHYQDHTSFWVQFTSHTVTADEVVKPILVWTWPPGENASHTGHFLEATEVEQEILFIIFETGSYCVAQTTFELMILLLLPPSAGIIGVHDGLKINYNTILFNSL